MRDLPTHVDIHEEGPREGFQIEPGPISTADKIKLIEALALSAMYMEGIVSKNVEAPRRSGRNESWLKIKCVQRAKFPIVSFVKDPAGVAALHVAKREGKDFV
jgi:ATP-dependent DNA ligase